MATTLAPATTTRRRRSLRSQHRVFKTSLICMDSNHMPMEGSRYNMEESIAIKAAAANNMR